MTTKSPTPNLSISNQRVSAFFPNEKEAYAAISELKDAGFTDNEMGFIGRSDESDVSTSAVPSRNPTGSSPDSSNDQAVGGQEDSVWQKMKKLFSGDSTDEADYHDASNGMDWEQDRSEYYRRGIATGGIVVSVTSARTEQAKEILERTGGDLRESGFENVQSTSTGKSGTKAEGNEEDYRIQLRGEVLRTFKERVQRGEVRLRKEVITENRTVQVPVTREELVIERVPASGQQVTDTSAFGSTQETRIPLTEERVRVEKQPVVTEEVRIGKRRTQRTEAVSESVQHEELHIDKDGDVDVEAKGKSGKKSAA